MKKIFFIGAIVIFVSSCSTEFKPSGKIPNPNGSINELFADSIAGMQANIKLDFVNKNCKSVSATYGENKNIFFQVIWLTNKKFSSKDCIEKYVLKEFKPFKKIKKNKNNFDYYAQNDSLIAASWHKKDFVFFTIFYKRYLDEFVMNNKYLKFK
jgi:hypothetical protein